MAVSLYHRTPYPLSKCPALLVSITGHYFVIDWLCVGLLYSILYGQQPTRLWGAVLPTTPVPPTEKLCWSTMVTTSTRGLFSRYSIIFGVRCILSTMWSIVTTLFPCPTSPQTKGTLPLNSESCYFVFASFSLLIYICSISKKARVALLWIFLWRRPFYGITDTVFLRLLEQKKGHIRIRDRQWIKNIVLLNLGYI